MCLALTYSPDFTRRKHDKEEPMVVYKVFVEAIDGSLRTPIMNFDVPNEAAKGIRPFVSEGDEDVHKISDDTLTVGEGFIHCYCHIKDAIEGFNCFDDMLCIYRCELRKGAEYYMDSVHDEIAAKEIWIDKFECYIG